MRLKINNIIYFISILTIILIANETILLFVYGNQKILKSYNTLTTFFVRNEIDMYFYKAKLFIRYCQY